MVDTSRKWEMTELIRARGRLIFVPKADADPCHDCGEPGWLYYEGETERETGYVDQVYLCDACAAVRDADLARCRP